MFSNELIYTRSVHVIIFGVDSDFVHTLQWQEFMNIGAEVLDEVLDQRIGQLAPNKCCTLIYTVICLYCLCRHDITSPIPVLTRPNVE